jgi:hypothetical protein
VIFDAGGKGARLQEYQLGAFVELPTLENYGVEGELS